MDIKLDKKYLHKIVETSFVEKKRGIKSTINNTETLLVIFEVDKIANSKINKGKFTDLDEFIEWVEKASEEEIKKLLNRYFKSY